MENGQTSQQLASGSRPRADALVLFGATGDLARRKIRRTPHRSPP